MGTQIPGDVDKILDPSMHKELFDTLTVGSATYYFIDQYDDQDGEPVIVRQVQGQAPQIVSDILPQDETAGGAAPGMSGKLGERLKAIRGIEEDDTGAAGAAPAGAGPSSQTQLNDLLRMQAENCADTGHQDHLSSANAPGTSNGKLACAWAVNRVAKMALGKQIGGGLATADMVIVLRDKHIATADLVSGCVVISPTVDTPNGRNIGHVGIVGLVNTANPRQTPIYSNSSGRARFEQNFTFDSWIRRYKDQKGLSVELFQLDPAQFPTAGV